MSSYEYDVTADALYIRFTDDVVDHQDALGDSLILDKAENGTVVGVEVLSPRRGWDAEVVLHACDLRTHDAQLVRLLARSALYVRHDMRPVTATALDRPPLSIVGVAR